ncbi:hypothetical protein D9758_003472 [Tetrapyrgos nigripes]|uniref:Uncharacterized protein n=1 Tax=Tetrapyrgos nigripes TaxID=182062 RepID=A0A8H5LW52_9AGAR|nr:hypothetical protein D9758_003472 [Tetrapyrgos nigripes]
MRTQFLTDHLNNDLDNIILPVSDDPLTAIFDNYAQVNEARQRARNGTHIDVHTVRLDFTDSLGVEQTVFSFSTLSASRPSKTTKPSKSLSLGVMNEQLAALVRKVLPGSQPQSPSLLSSIPSRHFKFYAILPLPYTSSAIVQTKYAVSQFGASGFFLTSNFDYNYSGNEVLRPWRIWGVIRW